MIEFGIKDFLDILLVASLLFYVYRLVVPGVEVLDDTKGDTAVVDGYWCGENGVKEWQ